MKSSATVVVVILVVIAQIVLPIPTRACGIVLSTWYYIESADVIALARIESLDVHELSAGSREAPWSVPRNRLVATLRISTR